MPPRYLNRANIDGGIDLTNPSWQVQWADGRNVRFMSNLVMKKLGETLMGSCPLQIPCRGLFTFRGHDNILRTIFCSDNKVYSITNNFTSWQDITPAAAPTGGINDVWTFQLNAGLPILSNGKDNIWKWTAFGSVLTPLLNAPTQAKVLWTLANRLIALDVTMSGQRYQARLYAADTARPEEWTVDRSGKALWQDLVDPMNSKESHEYIVGVGGRLNNMRVYTNFDIWSVEAVGEPYMLAFHILDKSTGLVGRRAIVSVNGIDYFMGTEDFYKYGGNGVQTLARGGMNRQSEIWGAVYPLLNKAAVNTSFAYYKRATKEVVFCYPTGVATVPNESAIYNTITGAWSLDNNIQYMAFNHSYDETGYQWQTLPYTTWTSLNNLRWEDISKNGFIPYDVVGDNVGNIYKLDSNADQYIDAYLESGDFELGNNNINKIVTQIIPNFKPQTTQNAVMIQVGTRNSLSDAISWSEPFPFILGVTKKADFRAQGKFFRIRISSKAKNTPWALSGYNIRYSIGGER